MAHSRRRELPNLISSSLATSNLGYPPSLARLSQADGSYHDPNTNLDGTPPPSPLTRRGTRKGHPKRRGARR